jgi:hypothetical protein
MILPALTALFLGAAAGHPTGLALASVSGPAWPASAGMLGQERSADKFVIIQPGYPGSTSEAETFVSDLAKAVEKAGGPKGLEGAYHNDEKAALKAIESEKPSFGIVSLGFFLAHRKDLDLDPLLASRPLERFFLAAKKGTPTSIADLDGEKVEGTPFAEKAFVARILFGQGAGGGPGSGDGGGSGPPVEKGSPPGAASGKPVAAIEMWKFQATEGFTKGVRDVARGRARAVLLTERERRAMAETAAGKELEIFYRTEPLPTALVVSFGKASPAVGDAARGMGKLKDAPGGEEIIRTMGIEGFEPVDGKVIEGLSARYEGGARSGAKTGD